MSTQIEPESKYAGLAEVTRMAGPIIFGSLSFVVMQFTDQLMMARLGRAALAASGPAGLWSFILSTFFLGVLGCVSTFASQSLGRGKKEDCARYTWQGCYISLASGLIAVALWPCSDALFQIMGHSPEVTQLEISYFRIRLLGFIFLCWQGGLTAFFQSVNRPNVPMMSAWISCLLNIGLNYTLIFGHFGFPRLGVSGAAIATVISQGVQAAYLQLAFLSSGVDREFHTRRSYAFDRRKTAELLHIGWPAGVNFFLDVFNWGIFTSLLVGRCGDSQMAAHNVAINFMHVSFMPAVGLNNAIAPIVGQWLGRGRVDLAKARTYTAIKIATVYMTTMGIFFAVFAKPLVRLCFSTEPEIVGLAAILLVLAALFQAFDAVNIVVLGALRGAGDTRWVAWASFLAAYFIFLPIAALLCLDEIPLSALPGVPEGWAVPGVGLQAKGAWIGATIYIIGLSGMFYLRFRNEKWRHINIFSANSLPEDAEDTMPVEPAPQEPVPEMLPVAAEEEEA